MARIPKIKKPGMYLKTTDENRVSVIIYEDIYAGWTDTDVASQLKDLDRETEIDVYINSYGGDAWSGVAIFTTLARFDTVNVYIDGHAESAASIVAMAGSTIEIAQAGVMMIHNALAFAFGNATKFEQIASKLRTVNNRLGSIYAMRTGNDLDQILSWMEDETTFSADEAVELGFATQVAEMQAIAAKGGEFKKDPTQMKTYKMLANNAIAKPEKRGSMKKVRSVRANEAINNSFLHRMETRKLLAQFADIEKGKK